MSVDELVVAGKNRQLSWPDDGEPILLVFTFRNDGDLGDLVSLSNPSLIGDFELKSDFLIA